MGGEKILIIDDNPVNMELASDLLKLHGFQKPINTRTFPETIKNYLQKRMEKLRGGISRGSNVCIQEIVGIGITELDIKKHYW